MTCFDEDYQETVELDGVGHLILRLIRPEDKALLVAGLHQLSQYSQYLRFFSPKGELSDEELQYLTELDNNDHLAIGAALQNDGEAWTAVGLARYVRRTNRPDTAEAAITVVDAFQHRGIGTLLMSRLTAAALQHGIRQLECEFLAENHRIEHLLHRLSPQVSLETLDSGRIRAKIPLVRHGTNPAALPNERSETDKKRKTGPRLFKRRDHKS